MNHQVGLILRFPLSCRRHKDKKEEVAEPEADPERDQRTVFAYQVVLMYLVMRLFLCHTFVTCTSVVPDNVSVVNFVRFV